MKIKLVTLTTLGALSLGSSAFAQEPTTGAQDQQGGRRGSRHNRLQRATEQLNLTPEQKARGPAWTTRPGRFGQRLGNILAAGALNPGRAL